MTIYTVKDWAGNVMNWEGNGEYGDQEEAFDAISEHVNDTLHAMGLNRSQMASSGLLGEYPELDNVVDKIYGEFSGEYWVDEIVEFDWKLEE